MTADVGGVRRPPPLWGVIDEARLLGSGGGTPRAVARHSVRPGTVARVEPGSGVLGSPGGFVCAAWGGARPPPRRPGRLPLPRLSLGYLAPVPVPAFATSPVRGGCRRGAGPSPRRRVLLAATWRAARCPGGARRLAPPFLPPSPGRLFAGFFCLRGSLAPGTARREALARTVDKKGTE